MSKIYDDLIRELQTNDFDNKRAFVQYIIRMAINAWDDIERDKNSTMVEEYTSAEIKIPETEDELRNKIQEIKSRNAGSWEPYMILKEVLGVDLINPPDSITMDKAVIENKQNNFNKGKGVFRRSE